MRWAWRLAKTSAGAKRGTQAVTALRATGAGMQRSMFLGICNEHVEESREVHITTRHADSTLQAGSLQIGRMKLKRYLFAVRVCKSSHSKDGFLSLQYAPTRI